MKGIITQEDMDWMLEIQRDPRMQDAMTSVDVVRVLLQKYNPKLKELISDLTLDDGSRLISAEYGITFDMEMPVQIWSQNAARAILFRAQMAAS